MAKSRGRKFAELIAPTNGVFAAASLPTIALSKLASSTFSVNSESASLGGNVVLDSNDITEHTSALYFTNARADTRADARIAAHNLLARAGGTMTGNLTLGDNVNVYFGASTDLRIYHDGTNSHIINSTGELRFTGSNFAIKSDSAKLYLGASDDLQIYHDGTHSVIEDAGTGNLILQSNGAQVSLQSTTELYLTAANNGAVTAYHNGSAKLATTSTGVAITGNGDFSGEILVGTQNSRFAENNLRFLSSGHAYLDHSTTGQSFIFRVSNSSSLDTTALTLSSSGYVTISNAFTLPNSDGSANQVLQTNGSGTVSWGSPSGSGTITAVVAGTNLTGGATSGSATVNLATNLSGLGTISSGPITVTTGANQALLVTGGPSSLHQKIYNTSTTGTYSYLQLTTVNSGSTQNSGYLIKNAAQNTGNGLGNNSLYLWNQSNEVELVPGGTIANRFTVDTNGNVTIRGSAATIGGNTVWHAGNDGAGSGLDADTLDGVQASGFVAVGGDTMTGNLTSTAASTSGILGAAYSTNYFGLKTSSQTLSSEYMIISAGNDTYISAGSGYPVKIRYGGNDSTNQLTIGSGATGLTWRGSTVWHAGNDGAGSGLDADTLDTLQATDFARLGNYSSNFGGTPSSANKIAFYNASGQSMNTGTAHLSRLECFQPTAGADAFMTFHVGSDYAFYFGLDGATNDLSVGGWSMGAAKYKVWHAGNDGAGSGLDADTLDGVQLANIARTDLHETFTSNITVNGNIYIGDGNDGYFYNDQNGRTAFAGGNFYIQSSVSNYYNYATNQYIGDSSGDNIYFRGNTLSGNAWTLTGAGTFTTSGIIDVNGGHGGITLTNSSIVSDATSTWTGDPGTQGKIQYHSNRWYIVADSSSNRIVQFRRNGTDVSYIDNSGNFIGNVTGNVTGNINGISTSALVGTHNGHNRSVQAEVGALHFYADGTSSGQANHAYALFQETGAWSNPYPDLKINYHTGIKLAANNGYEGIRFFTDYNTSSRVLQINGSSNYIFKDVWMHTDSGEGMYSSQNGMHFYPNSGQSSYSPITISGSRSSYGGIFDDYGDVNWMHDVGGNGGNWSVNFGWYFYFHRTNGCLGVAGSSTSSSYGLYEQGGGIYSTGNVVAYSDRRAKENIVTISNALDKTLKLRGVFYNKIDDETKTRQVGVIAQEMEEILPEAVIYAEDTDEYGVAYGNVVGLLIESIKELKQEVDDLKKKLEEK